MKCEQRTPRIRTTLPVRRVAGYAFDSGSARY